MSSRSLHPASPWSLMSGAKRPRRRGAPLLLTGVHREVLPNGLTLLLRRSTFAPVVALTAWFRVGYFHEQDHESGLAHLMEHMFFKGSQHFPGTQEIASVIEGLGGSLNAATTYDHTLYYFVLPSTALQPAVQLMADATLSPLLDPLALQREVEVIIEESNRKRDNPAAMAAELMYATAFEQHRIRRWRIGNDEVLRAMTPELARAFHQRLYRPAHLVVAIVGDIELEQARQLAVEAFSPMPVGTPLRENSPPEPMQKGLKVASQHAHTQLAHLELGIKLPGFDHPDQVGLGVLAQVLGHGSTSRLFRSLRSEQGLVRSISASTYAYDEVGLFHVGATLELDQVAATRRALLLELEKLRRYGVSGQELRIAREQVAAGQLFQLEEARGQASLLSWYEANGGLHGLERAQAALKRLTVAELKRLAHIYLVPEQATFFQYLPAPAEASTPEHLASVESLQAEWQEARTLARGNRPSPLILKVPPHKPMPHPTHTQRVESTCLTAEGNTVPLVMLEDPQLPIVSLTLTFAGGRQEEGLEQVGMTQLALRAARYGGAGIWSPDGFTLALKALGASLETLLDEEYLGFRLHLPAQHLSAGLSLLKALLHEPHFDPERLELERKSLLQSLRLAHEQPVRSAQLLMRQAAFGLHHPLGCSEEGREQVLQHLTREQLLHWLRPRWSQAQARLVVAGAVSTSAAQSALGELLSGLPSIHAHTSAPPWEGLKAPVERVASRPKKQTGLALALEAPSPLHADAPAYRVLVTLLSSSSGRMRAELRNRQSLAYSLGAGDYGTSQHNLLVLSMACDSSKEMAARAGLLHVLEGLVLHPPSQEELDRTRQLLLGRRATSLQTLSARTGSLAHALARGMTLHFYDQFEERLQAVTLEQLQAVAARWCRPERYALGVARGEGG